MLLRRTVVVAFYASSPIALAGTVVFDPAHVEVQPGETVSMTVTVAQTDLPEFDAVSMLFDGWTEWPPFEFVYDPSFLQRLSSAPIPPFSFCKWVCPGISVGGSDFATPLFSAPLIVGTVTVDTKSLAPGMYDLQVSASAEEKLFGFPLSVAAMGFTQEGLEGRATFTVVPEPSAVLLLLIGSLGVGHQFHRSRKRGHHMPRRFFATLVLVLSAAHAAHAGTVGFDPPVINAQVHPFVTFEISVSATDLAEFDSVSLLLGSNDGLTISPDNWTYDAAFIARLSGAPTPPSAFGVFSADLNVGGSDFAAPLLSAPLVIGTLTIPLAGLTVGDYEVFVNSAAETELLGFSLSAAAAGFTQEGLQGFGVIVIPEPATLSLLLIGVVAAMRGRRLS